MSILSRLSWEALSSKTANEQIVRNFAWTFTGNVIYGACQWLIWVLLARLGSPVMVGQYSLAQAIAFPIVLFSQLQLRSIQATDTSARVPFGDYLSLRTISTVAAFLLVVGAAIANTRTTQNIEVILLVGLAKCTESMSDVYFGHLQAVERMDRISKSLIVKGLSSVTTIALLLAVTKSITVALLGLNVVWLAVYFCYDRRTATLTGVHKKRNWNHRNLVKLIRFALPLGITMLFISLNSSIPRYFLFHLTGVRELGLFSVLISVQTAGMMVIMAMGQAATPTLARAYASGKRDEFRKLVFLLLMFSAGLGLVAVTIVVAGGDAIIATVFGRQYAGQNVTFIWLSVAAALAYSNSILGYAATASQRIAFQPWAYGLVSLITGLACILLVPALGARGAAISMIAGVFCGFCWYWWSFESASREIAERPHLALCG